MVRPLRLGLLAISTLTASCAFASSPGTPAATAPAFVVDVPGGLPDYASQVSVYAPPGLLSEVEYAPSLEGIQGLTLTRQDTNRLLVAWVGLVCETRPTLTLETGASRLVVVLDHGPWTKDCPAMGLTLQVALTFADAIPDNLEQREVKVLPHDA